MWRTGVTLLLVSLAVNAIQNADHIQFVNENAIMGKGPVRVVKNSDTLVADVPVEQKPKPEEPKPEDESTLSRAFRVIRSNAVPHALKLVGLGQGNQLADAQQYYTIPTSGNTVTLSFGKAASAVSITTKFSLKNDATFVYGKQCSGTACKKTAVTKVFDETSSTKDGPPDTTFKYQGAGFASGINYKDEIGLKDVFSVSTVFGVANAGDNTNDVVDSDGYFGLGFKNEADHQYNTLKTLLNKVAPKRALTIWQDENLKEGVIYLGNTSYSKCPKIISALVDTIPDNDGYNQWSFKSDKIEAGDASSLNENVLLSVDSDLFQIPQSLVDKINKSLDSNGKIDDPKKLPSVKITIGKDVIEFDGSTYTTLVGEKQYSPVIAASIEKDQYRVRLGRGILKKVCIVLQQKDDTGDKFQVGFIYPDTTSFSSSMSVSVFGLIMLPLVYLMGL